MRLSAEGERFVNKPPERAPSDPGVRERLLASAIDCFDRKGYAACSVREIVEAAGVTKPVLYYHYGSKEGIFNALMRQAMDQFDELLERASHSEGSARDRIEKLFGEVFDLFKRSIPLVRVMNSIYYGPPQGVPRGDADRVHFAFQEWVKKRLVEGRNAGEFKIAKTEDGMWALIGALNVATELELCHPDLALTQKDLQRVVGVVFDGIASEEGRAPRRAAKRR